MQAKSGVLKLYLYSAQTTRLDTSTTQPHQLTSGLKSISRQNQNTPCEALNWLNLGHAGDNH